MRCLLRSVFYMFFIGWTVVHTAYANMFVGYDEFCGLPVIVGANQQTATAERDGEGRPFIHIDPSAMNNWTLSRKFTLAHECAHHLLGHTSSLGSMERYHGGTAKQELEADCWAAKRLKERGLVNDLNFTMAKFSENHFSGNGYPSGWERVTNIKKCMGSSSSESVCRTITEACNHRKHSQGDQVQCRHFTQAHHQGDLVACQHVCFNGWGQAVRCHPNGDIIPCQHQVRAHQFDVVPCNHAAHPAGHSKNICQ